jgi:hypothetical protein
MERNPHESLDDQIERISRLALPGDMTPAAYAGVMYTLEGWKWTLEQPDSYESQTHRARLLKQWSEAGCQFFLNLPKTRWMCLFEVGDQEIIGHRMMPLEGGYALYDNLPVPPRGIYRLNFGEMKNIPPDSLDSDLPHDKHSDLRQLYVGDKLLEVAISFHQFTNSLLYHNGSINLMPKASRV